MIHVRCAVLWGAPMGIHSREGALGQMDSLETNHHMEELQ